MSYPFAQDVKAIVDLLVSGQYRELETLTSGRRLSAADIANAIRRYGRRLRTPPTAVYDRLDVVPVRDSDPARWSVRMNLWTAEEGRSDLSLELTMAKGPSGYLIDLDGIHVL